LQVRAIDQPHAREDPMDERAAVVHHQGSFRKMEPRRRDPDLRG